MLRISGSLTFVILFSWKQRSVEHVKILGLRKKQAVIPDPQGPGDSEVLAIGCFSLTAQFSKQITVYVLILTQDNNTISCIFSLVCNTKIFGRETLSFFLKTVINIFLTQNLVNQSGSAIIAICNISTI